MIKNMSSMKTVRSVEEFRHLYYPDPDPPLDYLDGGIPERRVDQEDEPAPASINPLDNHDGAHFPIGVSRS
jgi:hypothetical protein